MAGAVQEAEKICAHCGRSFAWRRKWARCWEQVRYCSERCRRDKTQPAHRRYEQAIINLLAARRGTICPSEVARQLDPEGWRDTMETARQAGRRLAGAGTIVVLQRGRQVDPGTVKGPIRFGRGPNFDQSEP